MKLTSLLVAAAVVLTVLSQAHADEDATPPVITFSPSGAGVVNTLFLNGDGSYNVGIEVTYTLGSTTVTLRPGVNGQVISNLAILHNHSTNNANFNIAKSANGAMTFGGVALMGWDGRNTGNVIITELRTTGNVGTIEVNSIVDSDHLSVDIGGNLTGALRLIKAPSGLAFPQLEARVRGNLLGVIDGPTGTNWNFTIERLEVDGNIGTSSTSVNIWPRGDIKRISAGGAVYANIDATKYVATGDIGHIGCAGSALSGSVKARKFAAISPSGFTPGLFVTAVTGDLDANITLTNAMDREIRVGRSFLTGRTIALPADGLVGQVILNGGNNSTGASWAGTVTLNNASLTNVPYYSNTVEDVGGGSVGLASFHLHDSSCEPPSNSTVVLHVSPTCTLEGDPTCVDLLACVSSPNIARMRFYGPLEDLAASNAAISADTAVTVQRRALVSNPTPWESISDTASEYKLQLEGTTSVSSRTQLRFFRADAEDFYHGYEYRVSRKNGQTALKCRGVTGTPVVADFAYTFAIFFDCRGGLVDVFDMDEDGILSYADIYAWMADQQDFNGDGADQNDLATLIQAILDYEAGA